MGIFILPRYQIFGKSAYRVEVGVICRREEILESGQDIFRELRLTDTRQTTVSAESLGKALNRRIRKLIGNIVAAAQFRVIRRKKRALLVGKLNIRIIKKRR